MQASSSSLLSAQDGDDDSSSDPPSNNDNGSMLSSDEQGMKSTTDGSPVPELATVVNAPATKKSVNPGRQASPDAIKSWKQRGFSRYDLDQS